MKKLALVGMSLLALSMFSTSAFAQTIVVNGGSYTCTTSCAINGGGDNTIIITDCCGGTVNGQSFIRLSLNRMQF